VTSGSSSEAVVPEGSPCSPQVFMCLWSTTLEECIVLAVRNGDSGLEGNGVLHSGHADSCDHVLVLLFTSQIPWTEES